MADVTVNQQIDGLPTMEQTMLLACVAVGRWMDCGIKASYADGWRDEFSHYANTAELARETAKRLRESLPMSREDFEREWHFVDGAVRVLVEAYPVKDSVEWRMFNAASETIKVMREVLDVVGD